MGLDINNKASLLQSFVLSCLMLYSGQVERVSVCCLMLYAGQVERVSVCCLMLYAVQVERVSVCCLAQSVQFAAII